MNYSFKKKCVRLAVAVLATGTVQLHAQNYVAGPGAGLGNTGTSVTAVGYNALNNSNSGSSVSAFGAYSLFNNTSGISNSGFGSNSLYKNKTGSYNTALGRQSLYNNVDGDHNLAAGAYSLYYNTTGNLNIGLGSYSLFNNSFGYSNVAIGYKSMYTNSESHGNIAIGDSALLLGTDIDQTVVVGNFAMSAASSSNQSTALGYRSLLYGGSQNTAVGTNAMRDAHGQGNTAVGFEAMLVNNAAWNTAIGFYSLKENTTGHHNTALGSSALYSMKTGSYNTGAGLGSGDGHTGDNGSFLGASSGTTVTGLTNVTAIGYNTKVDASNKVVVGNTSVTSIGGQVGWTTYSDERLKKNIRSSTLGLDFVLSLKPVTYNYKAEGQKDILYTGLLAQEVDAAAVQAGVVFSGVDKSGEYWGIRYGELSVPLIKAVQETNEKMKTENEALKSRVEKLEVAINKLLEKQNGKQDFNTVSLFQNQPNPFSQSSAIEYEVPAFKTAAIIIRSVSGSLVKQVNLSQAGRGRITIATGELPAGTYSYTLIVNGTAADTRLMVITR